MHFAQVASTTVHFLGSWLNPRAADPRLVPACAALPDMYVTMIRVSKHNCRFMAGSAGVSIVNHIVKIGNPTSDLGTNRQGPDFLDTVIDGH